MLVVTREDQAFQGDVFAHFATYVRPGDCLVLNNTRVFPARLYGRRNSSSGAQVEIFLVRALDEQETVWEVLAKPAKRVRTGDRIVFTENLEAEVLSQGGFGERTIRLFTDKRVSELIEKVGEMPLPPYIHRAPTASDRDRYQTVFAEKRGSIAAPTAGLHFTPEMLVACRRAGAEIAYVTLHVGLGTFAPLREADVSRIRLHEEFFEISEADAAVMRRAKRLFCVGTTSVRTIETALLRGGLAAMSGTTDLLIYPGYHFRGTGALLTNFHLPQSSLLMLVCAFGGRELMLAAYRHAVEHRYRFFSYGDCMLIV
jgi:S-adenosylmethionine:tRNA ribosyltransferase-isomerase